MKRFDHISVDSFEEAENVIKESAGKVTAMAGGTDLIGTLKDNLLEVYPEAVVSLKGIRGADYIKEKDNKIVIGANASLSAIASSEIIKKSVPAVAQAAYSVATPQIRNTGTIAGNLCQDVRCWYYRYPDSIGGKLDCRRKGGAACYAIAGENRYHSIFGGTSICGNEGCQSSCPAGTDISLYMSYIRQGNWDAAARVFMKFNPMPMMTSRICPHLCTDSCNQKTYGDAVNIPAVERTLGDFILKNKEKYYAAPEKSTGKKVAVIGAGPGGLTAAYYLRKAGNEVTVYDAHEKAGGVLMYGIPHYRLPKQIVEEYCDALKNSMGVRFVMSTKVGKDISVEAIKNDNDAVYLGTGAWRQPILGLEGEKLTEFGLNFLVEVNTFLEKAIGEEVLVAGGGNVAMDVALTAKRLGAKSVKLVCLEKREEMPASEEEVITALEEGIEIINGWGLGKILTDENGNVRGLDSMRCLAVRDEKGRFVPKYDEKERRVFESDFIILATGQGVDVSFLGEKLGAQLKSSRGLIDADIESGKTKEEGFYAGGDAVTGPNLAIRAIRAGRNAAATMNRDFGVQPDKAEEPEKNLKTFNVKGVEGTVSYKLFEKKVEDRTLKEEDRQSFTCEEALPEANRCLNCGCYAVNPSDLATTLVLLNAEFVTTQRVLTAKELLCTSLKVQDVLKEGELIKEIVVPKTEGMTHYDKRRVRDSVDFAIVALASRFIVKDGVIEDADLVLGAVAQTPRRADEAAKFLKGKKISESLAKEAADIALKDAVPMGKNAYKIFIAKDVIYHAVLRAGNMDASYIEQL